jgi:hypothetical protein
MSDLIDDRSDDIVDVALVFDDDGVSSVAEGKMRTSELMAGVFCIEYQNSVGGMKKEAHNAGRDKHGDVTHMLMLTGGGVRIGIGRELTPIHYLAGKLIAFVDADGLGHSSEVDHGGCQRVYMRRRGHLTRDMFIVD